MKKREIKRNAHWNIYDMAAKKENKDKIKKSIEESVSYTKTKMDAHLKLFYSFKQYCLPWAEIASFPMYKNWIKKMKSETILFLFFRPSIHQSGGKILMEYFKNNPKQKTAKKLNGNTRNANFSFCEKKGRKKAWVYVCVFMHWIGWNVFHFLSTNRSLVALCVHFHYSY